MNIKPYQRHLIVAAIGTAAVWLAITYLPLWAVLLIVFGVLWLVDKNNDLTGKL